MFSFGCVSEIAIHVENASRIQSNVTRPFCCVTPTASKRQFRFASLGFVARYCVAARIRRFCLAGVIEANGPPKRASRRYLTSTNTTTSLSSIIRSTSPILQRKFRASVCRSLSCSNSSTRCSNSEPTTEGMIFLKRRENSSIDESRRAGAKTCPS
jgi:hypothetical protein